MSAQEHWPTLVKTFTMAVTQHADGHSDAVQTLGTLGSNMTYPAVSATLTIAPLDRALTIDGWMAPDELTWLAEQAAQAFRIVEVGCWKGRTTRALADATRGTVWCVDPWTGTQTLRTQNGERVMVWHRMKQPIFEAWVENVADHLATGRVQVLPTHSLVAVRVLRHLAPFDLVFLDGDHGYRTVAPEIAQFRPLVRPGGILAGHDYGNPKHPMVQKAVDALVPDRQLVGSIWWTRV